RTPAAPASIWARLDARTPVSVPAPRGASRRDLRQRCLSHRVRHERQGFAGASERAACLSVPPGRCQAGVFGGPRDAQDRTGGGPARGWRVRGTVGDDRALRAAAGLAGGTSSGDVVGTVWRLLHGLDPVEPR